MTRTQSLKIQHDSLVDEIIALRKAGKMDLAALRSAQLKTVSAALDAARG